MLRFALTRLAQTLPVLVGVTLVVFALIHLVPGSPARTALGVRATPAAVEKLEHQWGLDRPLPVQYANFVSRAVRGDLGQSTSYHRPTAEIVRERAPVTAWLVAYSTILASLIAVPLATLAASRPGGARDGAVRLFTVAGLGIPSFWLGVMLIQWLAVDGGLFPPSGFGEGIGGHLQSMFLPSLTVALAMSPLLARSLRAAMVKIATAEFVTTARSKGLSTWQVTSRHVLRNAVVPVIAVLAVNVGFLIGGTVVVEKVFALPGLGDLMFEAIARRDFQVVQGVTLVLAVLVVLVNLLADLLHARLDPRVRAA